MATVPIPESIGPDSPILFVGDTHGDTEFWGYLLAEAERFSVEMVIQLGDFGFWPHTRGGMKYLELLNKALAADDLPLLWIDGNHDNHNRLARLPRRSDGLVEIGTHVTHVPRGARFELAGTSFLGIGGAYSIDMEYRLHHMRQDAEFAGRREKDETWWAGEMVTDKDVQRCVDGGTVDVVLAHDTPLSVSIEHHFFIAGGEFFKADKNTMKNRTRLQRVLEECKPKHWLNGHYHIGYHETLVMAASGEAPGFLTRLRGLGANVPHFKTVWDPKAAWWIGTPGELGASTPGSWVDP